MGNDSGLNCLIEKGDVAMEMRYWVWLSTALGAGSRRAEDILRHFANPQELYEQIQTSTAPFPPLTASDYQRFRRTPLSQAERILEQCARLSIDVVTPQNSDYPQRLLPLSSLPLVLYKKGDISVLNKHFTITVVGSRSVTHYGRTLAQQISYDLAEQGIVVVSGMALGGDEAAHIGALNAGGITVAILGCGLDVDYPKEHRILKEQVLEQGALISEYPPGSEPVGAHFPVRNRILSGVSNSVLIVECGERSGALITANHALEQGRDVFAVPGQVIGAPIGTFGLLRDGAVPVRNAEDILSYYDFLRERKKKQSLKRAVSQSLLQKSPKQKKSPERTKADASSSDLQKKEQDVIGRISSDARFIYEKMPSAPIGVEELMQCTGLSIGMLFSVLTELEVDGLISALPGGRYQKQ